MNTPTNPPRHTHTNTHTYTHKQTHTHTHTHTHTNTHVVTRAEPTKKKLLSPTSPKCKQMAIFIAVTVLDDYVQLLTTYTTSTG